MRRRLKWRRWRQDRAEGGSDLDDGAFAADRPARADGDGRADGLDGDDLRPDASAARLHCRHDLGHPVSLGLRREEMDEGTDDETADRGEQDHVVAAHESQGLSTADEEEVERHGDAADEEDGPQARPDADQGSHGEHDGGVGGPEEVEAAARQSPRRFGLGFHAGSLHRKLRGEKSAPRVERSQRSPAAFPLPGGMGMVSGRGLTREKILATALRLIDEEGLPALSMRRLGQELGVEAMALYKHVSSKQALLDGVVDLTMAGLHAPTDDAAERSAGESDDLTALGGLSGIFRSLRRLLQEHPNVLPLLASRPFGSAEGLAWAGEALALLRAGSLSETVVLSSFHALLGFTLGYAFLEAGGFVGDIPETEPLLRTNLGEMAKRQGPLVPGLDDYPGDWDHEADFMAGLGLIVAGAMGAAPGSAGK